MDSISSQNNIDDNIINYQFHGEIDKLRSLIPIIKCCRINRYMTFNILTHGFKLISEDDSHSIQGSIFLQKDLFKTYNLPNEPQVFEINIEEFLTIVEMLFPSDQLESSRTFTLNVDHMMLTLKDDKFHFSIKNGFQQGSASLKIQDQLSEVRAIKMLGKNRIVFDASIFVDFWNFTDLTSSYIRIIFDEEKITFSTESQLGFFEYRIDGTSAHVEFFECNHPQVQKYDMRTIKHTAPITKRSTKMCIRMDSAGTLNIQSFICLDSIQTQLDTSSLLNSQPQNNVPAADQTCYVEYYVAASIEDF